MDVPASAAASRFSELFAELFTRFHRRGPKRSLLTPQSWAVLQHLAMTGPLTVTEAARHMDRAQSVMSELVSGLEAKQLLARLRDARDGRRVLIWLTDAGLAALEAERQVLSVEALARAFERLAARERAELLRLVGLLAAPEGDGPSAPRERKKDVRSGTKTRRRP